MKECLIDTDILIEHLRNNSKATEFLASKVDATISYVTLGELLQGARGSGDVSLIHKMCSLFNLDKGSPSISDMSLKILAKYRHSNGIGFLDAVIAATALSRDLVLVTRNTRHFKGVEGLKVIDPF